MLSIIKKNIKLTWRQKKVFFVIVVFAQILSAFSVLFVSGAIASDYMYLKEDEGSLFIGVEIDVGECPLYYEELEPMFFEMGDSIQDVWSLMGCNIPCNFVERYIPAIVEFSVEDGKYVFNEALEEGSGKLDWGRGLTEEELNSDECYAIIHSGSKEDIADKIDLEGVEITITGVGYGTIGQEMIANPATAKAIKKPIPIVVLGLNRVISDDELEKVKGILDKYISNYSFELTTYSNQDRTAIIKGTITMSIITGIATLIVLGIIYNYYFSIRRKNYAIFQLVGCSRLKSSLILLGEMLIVSIPSLIAGMGLFYVCQVKWFNKIFKYLTISMTKDTYLIFFMYMIVAVVAFFIAISFWYSKSSIKAQLVKAGR